MAHPNDYPGRLIAIDGTRGADTQAAAAALIDALRARQVDCAISRFDASGLFGELAAARDDAARARTPRRGMPALQISVRTLMLVYAADLAFRLRWEIRPVLEAGGVVIAAPYVDTAAAFAAACGLSDEWCRQLLRFAPKPHLRGRAEERKIDKGWKKRLDRGFTEYSAAMLAAGSPKLATRRARRDAMARLDKTVRRSRGGRARTVFHLTETGVEALAQALTDSLRAASRRSASPPRSARR